MPLRWQDAAIDVLRAPGARRFAVERLTAELAAVPPEQLVRFVGPHGVGQLWLQAVRDLGLAELEGACAPLLSERRLAIARSLVQQRAAASVAALLEPLGVPYVFFKGQQLGRAIYADASLRGTMDVDVMVDAAQRDRVLAALLAAGHEPVLRAARMSHELTFVCDGAYVDVHWALLRPGRARTDLASAMLARRVREAELWVLDPVMATVVLLVHPAVTDYVSGRLIRAVDLDRWLRQRTVDWQEVLRAVRDAGLKTAAWATLQWTRQWLSTPVPEAVLAGLQPGLLRRSYLREWLRLDPAAVYARWPNLARLGFSLMLQDTAADVPRALRGAWQARRAATSEGTKLRAMMRPTS